MAGKIKGLTNLPKKGKTTANTPKVGGTSARFRKEKAASGVADKYVKKKKEQERTGKITNLWRESAAHEQNDRQNGTAPSTYAAKMMLDSHSSTEKENERRQKVNDYLDNLRKSRQEKQETSSFANWKAANKPDESYRKKVGKSTTELEDMLIQAGKKPKKEVAQEQPADKKGYSTTGDYNTYLDKKLKLKQQGAFDEDNNPLWWSDKHLETGRNETQSQIDEIDSKLENLQTKQKNKENWYPHSTYSGWSNLYADIKDGRIRNGKDLLTYIDDDKNIMARAREYKPGGEIRDDEENRKRAGERAFNYVFGYSDENSGMYDLVTEGMSKTEKADFDNKLASIIGGMQNPYRDFNYDAEAGELNNQRDKLTGELGKWTGELDRRQKIADLEANAPDATGIAVPERRYATAGNNPMQMLVNGLTGTQGDDMDRTFWAIRDQKSKWNSMTTAEKIDMLNQLTGSTSHDGLAESLQDTTKAYGQYYAFMRPEEVETFEGYYLTGDKDSAREYMEALRPYLQMYANEYSKNVAEEAATGDYGWFYGLKSIADAPMNAMVSAMGTTLAFLGNEEAGSANSTWFRGQNIQNATRGGRREAWGRTAERLLGSWAKAPAEFLNGVFYSMADMAVATGIGGALSTTSEISEPLVQFVMSSEAASNTMTEQLERGIDPREAALYAVGSGTIEWITEKYSIEQLLKPNVMEMLGNKKQLAKFIAKNFIAEGSEEGASSVLEIGLDALLSAVNGHETEIQERINQLKGQMGEKDATRLVLLDQLKQTGMEMLAGGVSSLLMASARVGATKIDQKSTGQQIRTAETSGSSGTDVIIDAALSMKEDMQSRKLAEEMAEKREAGKEITDIELGRLAQNLQHETTEIVANTAKTVVEDRAYEKLEESGMDDSQRREMAGIISGAVTGGVESLTKQERSTLLASKEGFDVLKEFMMPTETSAATIGDIMDKTRGEAEVQRSVSELLNKDIRKQTQSAEDTGEQLATEEDISRAEGKRTGGSREVIIDGKFETLGNLVRVTQKNADGKETAKLMWQIAGTDRRVEASQIKATDFGTAAIIRQAAVNPNMFSNGFTNTLLKANDQGEIKNVGRFMLEAQQIRIASYIGKQLPLTTMQRKTAQEIFDQAKYEHEKNRENDLKGSNAGRKAKIVFQGAEYGTPEWNKTIKQIKNPNQRAQIDAIAGIAQRAGIEVTFRNAAEVAALQDVTDPEKYYGWENSEGITVNVEGLDFMRGENGSPEVKGAHNMLVTFGHEMTHWLQRNSLKGYNRLEAFVLGELGRNAGKRVMEVMQRRDLTIEDAISEIVADSCDQILANESVRDHIQETNQGLFKEIKHFVTDLVGRVKDAMKGMKESQSRDSRAMLRSTNELARIWLGAYDEAISGKIREAEGEPDDTTRMSIAETVHDKDTLEKNKYTVANMEPGITLKGNEFVFDENHKTNVMNWFDKLKGVNSKAVGWVKLNKQGVRDSYAHGMAPLKALLFASVPETIKNGDMIEYTPNWKQRGYDSTILATKVKVTDGDLKGTYYVGAIVNLFNDGHNNYYSHDGIAAIANENGDVVQTAGPEGSGRSNASLLTNILSQLHEYNGKSGKTRLSKADIPDYKTYRTQNGRMVMQDTNGNETELTGLDREYVESWKKGDYARMEEILADKIRENGAIPFKAPNAYNAPNHRWVANAIKTGNMQAIRQAAQEMAQLVPENAVLVPMPNHYGQVNEDTDTKILADEIAEITGRPVINALAGIERESRKENKNKPKSQQMKAEDLGFRQVAEIPEGKVPYIVDNVIASGLTAEAAHRALGNNGITLAYAKSTMSANDGLKRANVTFYDTNKQYGQWLIPLSERIDMSKKGYAGTKFSQAEIDREYMAAVNDGNEQRQQELVDQAARDNGYTMKVYHGTPYGGFTQFRDWSYFTQNKDYADRYNHPSQSSTRGRYDAATHPMTYGLYMNPGRVLDTRQPEARKLFNQIRMELGMSELTERGLPDWTDGRDLIDYIEENDLPYDTIILDEGADGGYGAPVIPRGESYVTRSNMVKSADPVTYDDNGKAIPLSERFNMENNDIRFSMAEPVEETRDMIAVHNLTEQNLLDTLAEGGFTAPSIALIRTGMGHTKYGPISVLFRKDTIDPQSMRKNKVYGTDAWTPTRGNAQIVTKLNYEVLQDAQKTIRSLLGNRNDTDLWLHEAENWINHWLYEDQTTDDIDEMIRKAYTNDGIMVAYQIARGNEIEYKNEKYKRHSELQDNSIDMYNSFLDKLEDSGMLQEFMDDMGHMSGNEILDKYAEIFGESSEQAKKVVDLYRKNPDGLAKRVLFAKLKQARWFQEDGRQIIIDEKFSRTETAQSIRDNLNKKDFDNWIRSMIEGALGKKGIRNSVDLFTRSGNRRSFEATHMEPTAENIVKAMYMHHDAKGGEAGGATGLMAKGSKEYRNISEIKADKGRLQQLDDEEYKLKVNELDAELSDYSQGLSDTTGIDRSTVKQILIEAAGEYAASGRTAARNYFRNQGIKITDEQFNKAIALMDEAQEIPTGYFEAKPERVVGLDEIAKVIVPENATEVINALEERDIPYETYNGNDEDRVRVMNEEEDVRFSKYTSETMDVTSWMMAQSPGSVQTEAERQLLQDYKDLRIRISLCIKRQLDYKAEIKKLEDHLADLTQAQKDDLQTLYTRLQTQQEKQADLENELYRVTSSDGYAGMMRHYNIVLNDFITGKTQDQVRESVEQMIDQVKAAEKIIERQAKALRKMADSQAVKAVSSMINRKTLNYAVKSLTDTFNTGMGKTELESRLAEMALKRANGEDITEDARELAVDMTNQMRGYQNDVLERMRGVTIIIGPDQKAEMKGNGMTLQSVREQLKGTGVKVRYGDFSSLDTDTVDGGDLRTLLPELPQDIGENSGDALFKFISWAQSMRDTDQGMKQEMVDIDDAAVTTLAIASTIEVNLNSPEYRKQNQMAAQTRQMAVELEQAGKDMYGRTEEAGLRARGWASTLQRDVNEAIKYYNTIARKAAQEEKNKVRKNVIEQLKSQHTADLIKQEQKYKELMKNDRKARALAEDIMSIRNGINTVASRIRKRLMEETDLKNIPEEAKPLARQMLKMLVKHDFVGYRHVLFASKQMREQTMAALDSWEKRDGEFKEEDLDWLIIGRGEDADYYFRDRVEDALMDIESGLLEYRTAEGQRHITLMDRREALKKIDKAVEQIWSVIAARETANLNYKSMLISELAMQALDDMQNSRFKGEWTGKIGRGLGAVRSGVLYGNMTPEYFFKNLRNGTISQLYDEYKRAENRNGLEVARAKEALAKIAEETGYSTWDQKKRYTFQLEKGGTVSLTLGEMMSLYATWQRELMNQIELNGPEKSFHLEVGGFYTAQEEEHKILGREKFRQKAHRMTGEDITKIRESMTPEQLDYVNRVVRYMTDDIGALGNEASMRMFGIKKYNEKWYFPFEIWSGVKSKKSDQGAAGNDENRAVHASFTKRRRSNANNALVIRDFTETAVKHIGQMINYNTFAPAIEFMNRVMNYQITEEGEGEDSTTKRNLRTIFGEVYGKDAIDYLDNFNKDLNGGVVRGDVTIYDKLMSTFKKSAVAGSLSVAFQQPLSYIRASMMISPKYLAAAMNPATWKGSLAEMRKYSGVAVIKAMGKFDMNFGQSARDYMMPDRKTGKGRAIYNKASDAATALPGAMDDMTWTRMWTACKLEQQALHPEMNHNSKEFMETVAERFNDVMRKTQVYDSVLVKSKNMRSTNPFMKSLTSFMAEPTLTANVLADAVANFGEKGGKIKLAKAGATFLMSAVMQAIVKGLFGAGRSPDDKKTWDENVAYRFTYNFMNEVNPMSLIPGYSDLIALLKDGELQDDAMSVVGKILTAAQTTVKMASGKSKNPYRDIEDSAGQLAQLFTNIPAKNIMRDARAIYNYFTSPYAVRDKKSDPAVLKYQFRDQFFTADNLLGVVNKWLGEDGWQVNNTAYYKRIYAADKAGKQQNVSEMLTYLKLARDTKQDTINTGIRSLVKEDSKLTEQQKLDMQKKYGLKDGTDYITGLYKDGSIDRKTAEAMYRKENPGKEDKSVWETFDRIDYTKAGKLEDGQYYSSYLPLYDAIETGNQTEIRNAVKKMLSYGYKKENIKKQLGNQYKQQYIEATVEGRKKLADKLTKAYKELGVSGTEALKTMQKWVTDNNKKNTKKTNKK